MGQLKIDGTGHGKPVMPFGSDGADWYALLIDALGHLQVDVVSAALGTGGATETTLLLIKGYVDALETLLAGGLPAALDTGALKVKEQSPLTGFATSANQTTMITALQLIDDLRAALGSVATDKILVASKSGDKLFGFESVVAVDVYAIISGANGYIDSDPVPTGKVWLITSVVVKDTTSATTRLHFGIFYNSTWYHFHSITAAIAANQDVPWSGQLYLGALGVVRIYFVGGTAGDSCSINLTGVQMNAP